MQMRLSISLLVLFLLVFGFPSSVAVEELGFDFGANKDDASCSTDSLEQGYGKYKTSRRRILGLDAVLDYEDAGPNPKHDPRGRKPGNGGGKNP